MELEKFVQAAQEKDEREISRYSRSLIPRVTDYLKAVCGAPPYLAEEAATQAFNDVTNKLIKSEKAIDKDVLNYMLVAARNKYIELNKRDQNYEDLHRNAGDDDYFLAPAEQIQNLMDEERKSILRICLRKLDRISRYFIMYTMKYPAQSLEEIGKKFNYTYGTARKKKSNIIQTLQRCFDSFQKR